MESLKILVVDDESRMRKLVKDFLTKKGFTVIEAGDGEEAVDKFFEVKDIALIILDVMMPKMDGRFFVRVKDTSLDEVDKAFGKVDAVIEPDALPEEFGFITGLMTQGEYKERVKALGDNVLGMIRVKD